MTTNIHLLCDSILKLGSRDVETEAAAIAALVRCRWGGQPPACRRCQEPMVRDGITLHCTSGHPRHRCTVFVDTPLARLRAVSVRALFLALRGWFGTKRGIATLEIANEMNMWPSTLWRHLMLLRSLLPAPATACVTLSSAAAQVCGKYKRRDRTTRLMLRAPPGYIQAAHHRIQSAFAGHPPKNGRQERMMAENTRAFLNGTHHGVRAKNLHLYAREVVNRALDDPGFVVRALLGRIARPVRPIPPPPAAAAPTPAMAA